ncbi:DJ-1/PfpI family protein [Kitasatospora cheerisanensis]|uniref:Glutamine amidotransferase n=1 Tax=Kitasatospora cheerisanensis KCTC 2395 TaxID=1348663 RepID=A0A066YLV3_9ACTN|nr:DJ-1/PfpI family protein [Kitasatospora cheerisanensis]KDN82132.1 glutamine amidotransferase [Kitasatospora cheerisanensis KCTC 2395]
MKIAILLYDRFTALDAVGPYEVLSRMPGAEVVFAAERRGPVRGDVGSLALTADAALDEITAADLLLVPGGPGSRAQHERPEVLEWLRAVDAGTTWTTSVCSGSVLLAAAGLLTGRRATTHWALPPALAAYGAEPVEERVVFDGKYATAAGVSSGIDLGLHLAGLIHGPETAQGIQLLIEYDPQPPFDAGSTRTAPPSVVTAVRSRLGAL